MFASEALAASEQRFLSIFHSTTLGIKIMDLVGTVLETNSAFQAMSGYEETELIAMHFYDLVHPDDVAQVLSTFTLLKSGRQPEKHVEHRLCRKDGSIIWVRTTFAGVKKSADNANLSLIFGIVEDITARKQADGELMELRQHLQRSIEMERLRLAQNLHDTPLQELYAVIYKLEELRPSTRPATSEIIGQVIADIKQTLDGLRATASELRPPGDVDRTLIGAGPPAAGGRYPPCAVPRVSGGDGKYRPPCTRLGDPCALLIRCRGGAHGGHR
jgi:PAS domain S-box-containing protein